MREIKDGRGAEAGLEEEAGFDPADFEPRPFAFPNRRRSLVVVGVLGALVLMAVLPPLINVNRFRRQIAGSISQSLGRPVHMDAVTLNVLPIPGFTLENFVVGEDPGFGSEPVIRANSVRARLRLGSLWRRRVEFSRISLTDTSLNLVHRADGRWNIESILLQASRMKAAPTAQAGAGRTPRFPYVEATGARVNVKMGLEKMPIALTEADFALWLPRPEQWRLRLEGHPARTDTAATDTGTVMVQGTLGRAGTLGEVPLELAAEWSAAPLGGVSKVLAGSDAGVRGEMRLRASVAGTVGENRVDSRLELRGVRRAEFFPAQTLDVDVVCKAQVLGGFRRLEEIACAWPPDAVRSGLGQMVMTGEMPDVRLLRSAKMEARWTNVPLRGVVDGLREVSSRVSRELDAAGVIVGRGTCCGDGPLLGSAGSFSLAHARASLGEAALYADDAEVPGELESGKLTAGPFALALGGPQPAMLMIQADESGLRMRLTGTAMRSKLLALGMALPQFGDGLEGALPIGVTGTAGEIPLHLDLVSARTWSGEQVWSAIPGKPAGGRRSGTRH